MIRHAFNDYFSSKNIVYNTKYYCTTHEARPMRWRMCYAGHRLLLEILITIIRTNVISYLLLTNFLIFDSYKFFCYLRYFFHKVNIMSFKLNEEAILDALDIPSGSEDDLDFEDDENGKCNVDFGNKGIIMLKLWFFLYLGTNVFCHDELQNLLEIFDEEKNDYLFTNEQAYNSPNEKYLY